jgi:aspartyl-tRNA(Asn)/glutamyl-tRNA(Gln) amidotransferase subunit A
MADLPLTLTETVAALRDRAISSGELVEEAIARADRLDERLGVYITRFDESARAAAAQADADFAAGVDRGRLQGIPFGVKDNIASAEGPTTAQSLVLDPAWGENRDAIVIERLRAVGGILLGKVSMSEFAVGLPDPDKTFPVPRNPWDTDTWPGGSSSGTGAGVAAGMFLAGLGTDTLGSIRIPAIFCGVSGLKPTYGLVPNGGSVPLAYSLDHIGPIARSARDCGLVLAAIAGSDPRDPHTVERSTIEQAKPPSGSLHGLRIGVAREHHLGLEDEDPALTGTFDAALAVFAELGAAVRTVAVPHYREVLTAAMVTSASEWLAYHMTDIRARPQDYVRSNRATIPLGACFSGADYVQAQRVRRVGQRALGAVFEEVDVIATPAASRVAPSYASLLESGITELMRHIHTMYWNAVGNPALVVPMGINGRGLPLSLQLAGRSFDDDLLIHVGDAFQQATDWHLRVPPVAQQAACGP